MASAFSGAGVILVWELFLKPRINRRGLASALAAELSRNAHYLNAQLEQVTQPASEIPLGFRVSTLVFSATAPQIGLLPPMVVADLVDTYFRFDELNRMGSEPDLVDPEVFRVYLKKTIAVTEYVVRMLGNCGAPGWTLRQWAGMTDEQRVAAAGATVKLDRRNKLLREKSDARHRNYREE